MRLYEYGAWITVGICNDKGEREKVVSTEADNFSYKWMNSFDKSCPLKDKCYQFLVGHKDDVIQPDHPGSYDMLRDSVKVAYDQFKNWLRSPEFREGHEVN